VHLHGRALLGIESFSVAARSGFRPVTLDELRALWRQQPDPAVQRLALEVVRCREVIAQIDQLYQITHQAWRDTPRRKSGGLAPTAANLRPRTRAPCLSLGGETFSD